MLVSSVHSLIQFYIHIYIFFKFSSLIGYYMILWFPVLYSRSLWVICLWQLVCISSCPSLLIYPSPAIPRVSVLQGGRFWLHTTMQIYITPSNCVLRNGEMGEFNFMFFTTGASLVVQWLRLWAPGVGGPVQSLVRSWIPHAAAQFTWHNERCRRAK